jgi:hypothetical protein
MLGAAVDGLTKDSTVVEPVPRRDDRDSGPGTAVGPRLDISEELVRGYGTEPVLDMDPERAVPDMFTRDEAVAVTPVDKRIVTDPEAPVCPVLKLRLVVEELVRGYGAEVVLDVDTGRDPFTVADVGAVTPVDKRGVADPVIPVLRSRLEVEELVKGYTAELVLDADSDPFTVAEAEGVTPVDRRGVVDPLTSADPVPKGRLVDELLIGNGGVTEELSVPVGNTDDVFVKGRGAELELLAGLRLEPVTSEMVGREKGPGPNVRLFVDVPFDGGVGLPTVDVSEDVIGATVSEIPPEEVVGSCSLINEDDTEPDPIGPGIRVVEFENG